ncbi:MAG: flagellar motor switch protein FliM [Deltaproteobacteria bacterium]|nr:flagellar motor switch protein FliM [Deltaproteobacteria bacterium]
MAERVLSQEEIDALMRGVATGGIETESDKSTEASGVRQFDLASQERVVRGRMPAMEIINERFCRSIRISLFNFVRKVVDVSVEGIKMMKYGEFMKNTPFPASLNIFQLPPLRGSSVLVLDANLIFLMVDNYFGGGGKYHTKVEGREFTALEQKVIRRIADIVFSDMKSSWHPVSPVDFVYSRSEINPQFANVVVPTEIVIVSTFRVEIETATSSMHVCIPYSTVEPIKEKLYAGYQSDRTEVDRRWLSRFEEEIRKAPLLVSCEMGRARVTIEDFLNLNAGDIIRLDRKVSDPLTVNVEGVPKLLGSPGMSEGHYAVQITGQAGKEGE